jgi:hypothetical protein
MGQQDLARSLGCTGLLFPSQLRADLANLERFAAFLVLRYLVEFTTTTFGFRFSVQTGTCRSTAIEFYD